MQARYNIRLVVILLVPLWSSMAGAQSDASGSRKTGTIVQIDRANIYVDLGAHDQLIPGSKVELLEVVTIPGSEPGKTMSDDFPLGTATVRILGANLCILQVDDTLVLKRIKVGDRARPIFTGQPRQYIDPWIVKPPPPPAPPTQKEAASLIELIAGALGKTWPDRIRVLEDWEIDHEASLLGKDVGRELDSFRALYEQMRRSNQEHTAQNARHLTQLMRRLDLPEYSLDAGQPIAVRPPGRVHESEQIPLAFLVLQPEAVTTAQLYYRQAGDSKFQRLELTRSGTVYLHGVIPGEVVRAPTVEYFVEASDDTGSQPRAVLGSVDHPRSITVQSRDDETHTVARGPHSEISMRMDYVDFDGFSTNDDQYWQAEFDFMYRFDSRIHAMRVGSGTLRGTPNDYSYIYAELEFALSSLAAIMIRPQFGTFENDTESTTLCPDTVNEMCKGIGLRARLRIGKEQSTNLVLGTSLTQGLGELYEVLYNWPVFPTFPVQLSTQVTNIPDNEHYALRFVADIGWRRIPWVYPSFRLSAQVRNGDEVIRQGISGGLGLNFQW